MTHSKSRQSNTKKVYESSPLPAQKNTPLPPKKETLGILHSPLEIPHIYNLIYNLIEDIQQ